MTQLRKKLCPRCGFDLDPISNHFDELFQGIGHRGSSFMDIDGLMHDGKNQRFLTLEFKHLGEEFDKAAAWALTDFAKKPGCQAIAIRILEKDIAYRVKFFPEEIVQDQLSPRAVRNIVRDWWNRNGTK